MIIDIGQVTLPYGTAIAIACMRLRGVLWGSWHRMTKQHNTTEIVKLLLSSHTDEITDLREVPVTLCALLAYILHDALITSCSFKRHEPVIWSASYTRGAAVPTTCIDPMRREQ